MALRKSVTLGIALLLVCSSAATAATRVNWTWSGVGVQNIALDDPFSSKMILFEVEAKGSPGTAKVIGLNRNFVRGDSAPTEPGDGCFEGANLKLTGGLSENSLVATFKDLSLLTMLKDPEDDGFACIEFATGHFYAEIPIYFNGGFGRFAKAKGKGTIRLHSWPVGPVETATGPQPSILVWEIGTITGSFTR